MKTKLYFSSLLFICVLNAYSTKFYSGSAGALNLTASWWSNTTGTALPHPANFITASDTFVIINNTSATLTANWTVSGSGSIVQVGDGTQTINFTIPTGRTVTATINVMNNGTLTNAAAANPTFGTLSAGSTVDYSDAANQNIVNVSYYNLTLSGSGTKSLLNVSNTTITNVLTINTGIIFALSTTNTDTAIITGTIAGTGTIKGGANSNLKIGGTGSFGTITPSASPLTLDNFTINRGGLGSVTLGGNITVNTSCSFSNGVINLNGNTLTLNGTLTFPTSSTNGTITGSATSNLSIGATSITNSLFMDETTPGTTNVLKNFTLNSAGQTLILGTDLTVSGAYTQTKGIVNINGNTLTLSGTATFATTAANGTISGSATSNLSISATTITNDLFMTAGSQLLGNFTLNSAGKTLILGAGDAITISGIYTQTNGIVRLNGQSLTLSGTVVFPVASANGTITGSAASNLNISATSITNDLFLTGGAQTFNNFTLNSSGQTLILGAANNLTVAGAFTQTNGTLNLNGNTLTLSGTAVFPVASSNGVITGSSTSIMSITATSISNSLFMDQTTPGTTNVLKNITLNSAGQTLTLGNGLTVSGAYAQTKGIVSISAGSTLSLTGTATFPTTAANGTISGTTTSNLSISATTITNDLFMTSGAQVLGNFTLNSVGKTLTLGAGDAITINGTFTQTNGIISLGAGNSLTLAGAIVFPAASANGTITGTATSSLSISGTSITNDLYMTAGSQKLSGFTLNSPGQTLTLGAANNITVSGPFNQTNGSLNLNGNTLTLSAASTAAFPAAASNGVITGSATSALVIDATSISGVLSTDQTTPGTSNELKTFTLNSTGQTLTLGGSMVIISGGTYTHTNGIVSLNGNTLTLNGATTFPAAISNGSYTGSSTSSISVGGAGNITNDLFMTQTSSSTNSLSNLTLNRTGKTITLGNALNVIDSISPTLGTIAGGGNITLIADQVNVGHVGRIGRVGGTLTGNITSQVFHNPPPGNTTNWMLMGSPGVTGQNFTQWNSAFQITCSTCPDGSSPGGTPFTSITTFSEPTGTFPGIVNITDPMTIGVGYWVFMGNSSQGTASSSELISVTGPAQTGNFSWPTLTNTAGAGTYQGNNLIANPYPSPISWNKVMAEATNSGASALGLSTIYAYSTTYSGGDYVTYNSSSDISVPAYVVGTNSIADVIPAGMGFYVITSANTTLHITENDKVSGNNQNFLFRQANPASVKSTSSIPYFSLVVTGGTNNYSEVAISFNPNGTLGYDSYDAPALAWNYLLQISTVSMGKNYTINGLPLLNQNYTIPVQILSGSTTQYTLTPTYLNNIASGACLSLHDNYTNTNYDLRAGPINLTINDTETVPRFILNITIDTSTSVLSSFHNPTCANSGNGYMIANPTTSSPWNYYWKDASNNIIKTSLNKNTADTLNNANAGFYHVDINTSSTCNNATATYTLQGSVSPTALFITPSSTVILVNDTVSVSFTNTSINANTYLWNFGDGTQATYTNTTHQYTNAGVYVVSLTAVNQLCGDTNIYTQVITVDTVSASTGIKTFVANENNMLISRDAAGYYVQFNYPDKTNAVISVQNLLGEKVVADISQENVLSNKTCVPLGNTANNVLIISVITTAGEKTFRKVINSN
jgi:PKD domain-containing protein